MNQTLIQNLQNENARLRRERNEAFEADASSKRLAGSLIEQVEKIEAQNARLRRVTLKQADRVDELLNENVELDIRLKAACIDGGAIEKDALDKITKHVLDKIAAAKRRGRPEPPSRPGSRA